MAASKSTPWILSAALVSVVILVMSWFFAISPTLTIAADSRVQAVQEREHNELLQVQIGTLAKQFANIDEYKADLAALQIQIPAVVDLAALTREVDGLATAAGVTLTAIQPGVPEPFVLDPAVAVAPQAADANVAGVAAGTTQVASAGVAAPAGLFAVPLSLTLAGSYEKVTAFLGSLQTGSQRLLLVGGLSALAQEEKGAADGRPALVAGDIELTIGAFAYVLQETAAAPAFPVDVSPPVLPAPTDQKNPFLSVS